MNAEATSYKLRVVDLNHAYGDRQVLRGISFEIKAGQMLGFLGPNGAGKTTTFHLLTGLLPIQRGSVSLDGHVINPMNPQARERLGVVFQTPSLDNKLSAGENLSLAAGLFRVPGHIARERAERLLKLMELGERAKDKVQTFSGGMKRRLEIARALIHEPEFLVLDEPTTGLDEAAYQKTWQRLLELRRGKNMTMLLTTHRADEAEHCDELVILDQGRIIAQGTPDALRQKVSGDALVLELNNTADLDAIVGKLHALFNLDAKSVNGRIHVMMDRGHEMIPRLVEQFPQHTFRSINIHRPTLGDVFMRLTGKTLTQE